ncbi:Kinesin KIF19 [Micractinium conductrix]|uniref:Kinesin KIF19 n=1 Tax=Micractinium conductrix TaxID=554055 RepID=A0A2P6VR52_9CHLO|nr:Kinesin KIF19 [Micractinium conductrix]|eukprot:PSC76545.1 Kinesin KIF19 [Micractinium conductrix]
MAPPDEPAHAPTEAAAAAAVEGGDGDAAQPRSDSEEDMRPVSLTDLFAADPECAGKSKAGPTGGLARSLAFAGAGLDDELELKKLQVFVRIRPSVTTGAPVPAGDAARENCVHATSRHSLAIAPPEGSQAYKSGDRGQTYAFTRVFDSDTPQDTYFESTTAPLVRDLLRNPAHNSVMMAYGITAAGKTYTIEGTKEAPGVLPRSLMALFEGLAAHAEPVVARAAYYELYKEQIYDLLERAGQGAGPLGQRVALRLKEDTLGRVFVEGLSEVEVGSAEEAHAVLRRGSRQRQRAETGLNYSSSRSHSIFTITLYQEAPEGHCSQEGGEDGCEEKLGRMSFVDLAGSERAQRTGNVGVRLKESVAINSSLMTLGRCLEALRWNQQHRDKAPASLRVVPYRESKVTHLFRDALHGWGQVVLSVNVSPVSKDYDETAHVLKYAALATQIGTMQQAEAPRRTIKAQSPAIRKVKRKAALPPEARRGAAAGGGGNKAKKPKKGGAAHPGAAADLAAIPEAAELAEGSDAPAAALEQQQHLECGTGGPHAATGGAARVSEASTAVYSLGRGDEEAEGDEEELDGSMEEEEEGAYGGTPTTPLGDEDEAVAVLQAQVQQLIGDLQRAEERCVLLEADVRAEVAEEMGQLLRDMEESYRQRLEAEVAAAECKLAAGAGARRGRGGMGGKGAAAAQASSEELAAVRVAAEQAEADAEELEREVEELQQAAAGQAAQLADAQAALAGTQAALEEARAAQVAAEAAVAQAGEHAAGLEADLAAAQAQAAEAAAGLEAQLAAAQAQAAEAAAGLEAQLAAAQAQAADAAAGLAAEQQRSAGLEADLAAARQQAEELRADLEVARAGGAGLAAEVARLTAAADSDAQQASVAYEAQLQEAVTQLEANKCMELEMSEEQCERLRKDNVALRMRLHAALAALAACGSPAAGPGNLAARMAQAAPEGNGRGAGGTPHDVALARARLAAAADDAAAAAAAAAAATEGTGGSTVRRSRFAAQALAEQANAAAEETAGAQLAAGLAPVPEEGEGRHQEEQQQQMQAREEEEQQPEPVQQEEQQPEPAQQEEQQVQPKAAQRRGRKKAVAFAGVPEEEPVPSQEQQPQQGEQQPQQAEQQAVAPAESRRGRRMTRAAAAAAPLVVVDLIAAPQQQQEQQPEARPDVAAAPQQEAAGKQRRGRRHTQAPAVAAAAAAADADAASAALQPAQLQPAQLQAEAAERQAPAARKGKTAAAVPVVDKENAAAATQPAAVEQAAEQAAKGGKRRKRALLPSAALLSTEMREELGEAEEGAVPLRRAAQKQAAAAGGGKCSRRQTQFFRL